MQWEHGTRPWGDLSFGVGELVKCAGDYPTGSAFLGPVEQVNGNGGTRLEI